MMEMDLCDEDKKGSNSYYNCVDPKALEPVIELKVRGNSNRNFTKTDWYKDNVEGITIRI